MASSAQQLYSQMASQPRPINNSQYMPNGAPTGVPAPGAVPLLPNQGRVVQAGGTRILCVADVRGNLTSLNDLAKAARADYIVHTGDFGFYDDRSLDRIAEKTLRHVVQYSPLITEDTKRQVVQSQPNIKERIPRNQLRLSQLPDFLTGQLKFDVPIYTVWGACEDVQVLEKLRSGEHKIEKLHILDEAHSRLLEVGGVKLRLLGLGGAVVMHKLFDNGEGRTTIAGGQGTMWTTLLQMGELVDTANRVYDPSETRLLVTHASPARDGLLNQLTVALKVDISISAGLHFRYGSSYNEFSVNPSLDHYRGKLASSKASFQDVWETVKSEVEPAVAENEAQQKLLNNALDIVNRMPSVANGSSPFGGHTDDGQVDEMAFKNMWNFNLADAAFGYLVLEVEGGRIGTEMRAQGFNFAHRGMKNPAVQGDTAKAALPPASAPIPSSAQIAPQPAPTHPNAAVATSLPIQQNFQHPKAAGQPQAQGAPPIQPQLPSQQAATAPSPALATTVATSNGTVEKTSPGEAKSNGVASPGPGSDGPASKGTPPAAVQKPSTGIYVTGLKEESEVRALFSESERAKILRVDKVGKFGGFAVHFSTPEEMQEVFQAAPADLKSRTTPGKPNIRVYQERGFNSGTGPRPSYGQGGYKSGGASDSETGRGRGGSYRSRGGSRGNERGTGRGGPRGGGRGRGTPGEGANAGSPSPAPTPSATTS